MVALLVLWNVVLAVDYQHIRELAQRASAEAEGRGFQWTFIASGSAIFVAVICLLSILGAQLFIEIRLTQRLADFIATFTHELNSPLASIKLFTQTLRRSELSRDEQERFLDLILADVDRLRGQISNVLRAAQADRPVGLKLAADVVDLHEYLLAFTKARQAAAERLPGDVTVELADGPGATGRPRVNLDSQLFRHALDNLVDNAIKYARQGEAQRVEIAIAPAPVGWVAFEVRDTGRGIHKDDLVAIFDRFRRIEQRPGESRTQGTGLGLWVVHAVVDAHGGQVEAQSDGLDKGATIRVELPEAAPEERLSDEERVAPEATPRGVES
jgi:two-component system, OmpR family, sensor histidine kinase SenX3